MSSRTLTIAGFVVLAVGFAALAACARRPASRFMGLGRFFAFICRDRWVRAGVIFLWLWLGWHFLART